MKTLLIADDETIFTQSLAEGLAGLDPDLRVLTAENGLVARNLLETEEVNLLLTDLKMPVLDGFELLAWLSANRPNVSVLVMTAFGTTEIAERLRNLGFDGFIEKPIDFGVLSERIAEVLSSGASGFVRGIPLPTFLQILEIERKTCALEISAGRRRGVLRFSGGVLHDAETEEARGEAAAADIVCWRDAAIQIKSAPRQLERTIQAALGHILLESFRLADEKRRDELEGAPGQQEEERQMSVQEKLKELAGVDGFAGAGVYTPGGENLAILSGGTGFTKEIGILANNVLMNAQKASIEMGSGRGQMVHVEAEKAHLLVRCLNEGTDPLKSQPGKAHIHLVAAFSPDASIGMAKLRVSSVIDKLGEDFRF